MSTSTQYKPLRGANGEVRELINSGAQASYSNGTNSTPVVLSATSCQDLITNTGTSTTSTYYLPALTANKIGMTKIINSVAVSGTSISILPGNGQVIQNGNTLVGTNGIVFGAAGPSVSLQYVGLNRWKIYRTAGTVTIN